MAQAALRHIVLGLATSGLLMGCVQSTGSSSSAGMTGTSGPARTLGADDIEAPEVFQATDSALWDGRPSLGGIWVAAPDAKDPERVIMVNPANGKAVQGALFRRERDNPGPRLQLSSDAAEALGILAGQPVEIRVTALRRAQPEPAPEVVPPTKDTAVASVEGTEASGATAADPATDGEAAATAAAATAALAATGAISAEETGGATDAGNLGADGVTLETAVVEPPKPKTWKERRAEAKAAREAKRAAAAAEAAGVTVEIAAPDGAEVPATPDAVAVGAVTVTALDGVASDAGSTEAATADVAAAAPAETVAEPRKTRRQIRAEEAAAKAAAEAAAAAEATTGRPIQVAAYSKEANADRAVEALAKIGIVGETRKVETNGDVIWSVVTSGDEAQLNAIKGFGFADAFFLP